MAVAGSQRLHKIMQGARDARLAYQRGEISHEVRMQRIEALRRPKGPRLFLSALLMRYCSVLKGRGD